MNKQIKKSIIFFYAVTLVFTLFIGIPDISADNQTGLVTGSGVSIRPIAGTSLAAIDYLSNPATVTVLSYGPTTDGTTACNSGNWYNIQYNTDKTGYICSSYLTVISPLTNDEYEQELKAKGFPDSYLPGLKALHSIHPNWVFNAYNTNLDWNAAVSAESVVGMSLIDSSEVGYRSVADGAYNWDTNTWIAKESGWYAANRDTVAYYMDPRNFFNETRIFMFEELKYQSSFQTRDSVVKSFQTWNSTYSRWDNTNCSAYVDDVMQAATTPNIANDYGVSPIHLASRIALETGRCSSISVLGNAFNYRVYLYDTNGNFILDGNGNKTIATYPIPSTYNFYNIRAYNLSSSPESPPLNGLVWANGGTDRSAITYLRPWNTPNKSIIGGAEWIAEKYISIGQSTPYFQKWDVSTSTPYNHQYMTNIRAPFSESDTTYKGYNGIGLLSEPFVFTIPIYNNMPTNTSLPKTGNPNNYLNGLSINDKSVDLFNREKLVYDYYVSTSTNSVNVAASKISSLANITGTGTINLTGTTTPININVTAQNGDLRTYTINVIQSDQTPISVNDIINNIGVKSNGTYINGLPVGTFSSAIINNVKKINPYANIVIQNLNGQTKDNAAVATGDIVAITSNNETKTYTTIVYGDNNGDGNINIIDLLRVQKAILKSIDLSTTFSRASDVNKDGSITIMDLLKVQKHILGSGTIEQ